MFSIIRVAWFCAGLAGTLMLWLSTNSIPETVKNADGYLATNLRYLGWEAPPSALATTAADNIGAVIGIVLLLLFAIGILGWILKKLISKKDVTAMPATSLLERSEQAIMKAVFHITGSGKIKNMTVTNVKASADQFFVNEGDVENLDMDEIEFKQTKTNKPPDDDGEKKE